MIEASASACSRCGTQLGAGLLVCPSCRALVHRDELTRLAAEAERATEAGERAAALVAWRRALELLPAESRQHARITDRVRDLSREVDTKDAASSKSRGTTAAGIALFLLAQAKFLLGGLTKLSTLLSMLVSLGVYWTAYGHVFAAGLIASIYVHEMGHVAALRRYGIAAGAPMFIPGFGALVRMKQYPVEPREDARVGLAGPIWGLGAALFAYGGSRLTGLPSLMAIARTGAWINLFNLLPLGPLDGGRGFRAMSKQHQLLAAAVIGIAWFLTSEGILILLLLGAVFRVAQRDAPDEPDGRALVEYTVLIIALSALAMVRVPGP